jgi:hypothetical protein
MHDSDIALAPLPTIDHIFRQAEKRPASIISFLFSAVVVFLLCCFLGMFLFIGINFSNFPGGLASLYSLGFHVSLGATLAILVYYWLQLTIAVALQYLVVSGASSAFFGYYLLRNHDLGEDHLKRD